MKPDKEIDCVGLFCPEPIFRTRTVLDEMEKGQILKVTADDPAAEEDLTLLAKRLDYEIVEVIHSNDEVIIYIKK